MKNSVPQDQFQATFRTNASNTKLNGQEDEKDLKGVGGGKEYDPNIYCM